MGRKKLEHTGLLKDKEKGRSQESGCGLLGL